MGKKVIFLPSCHSTNAYASQLISRAQAQEGLVVCSSHQSRGKGQRGNHWESAPGKNLTFSFICRPLFLPIADQFFLHMLASLGIIDFLNALAPGLNAKIKWPNDIYLGHQKLAGILVENTIRGQKIDFSVVGIGLNVNQAEFNEPKARSLHQQTGHIYNLEQLLASLLGFLDKNYALLATGKLDLLRARYTENLFWHQETQSFKDLRQQPPRVFLGMVLGINSRGQLAIASEEKISYFDFKEVAFLI